MHAATPVYFVLRRYRSHMLDKYVNKLKLKIIRYVINWKTENLDIKIITNQTLRDHYKHIVQLGLYCSNASKSAISTLICIDFWTFYIQMLRLVSI